jgi:hypothetical protein
MSYLAPGVLVSVQVYTNPYPNQVTTIGHNSYTYEPASRFMEGLFLSFNTQHFDSCNIMSGEDEFLQVRNSSILHVSVPWKHGTVLIAELSVQYLNHKNQFHRIGGPAKQYFNNPHMDEYWIDGERMPNKEVYELSLFTLHRQQVHV